MATERAGGGRRVVGFLCATAGTGPRLGGETMSHHVSDGDTVCVHSVVTRADARRRGIATWMMRSFVRRLPRVAPRAARVALLTKPRNEGLYARCGFLSIGASPVEHGAEIWVEMQQPVRTRDAGHPVVTVDAFAEEAYAGNPAAVVVAPGLHAAREAAAWVAAGPPPGTPASRTVGPFGTADAALAHVAEEMNLSETAFLWPLDDGSFLIRWLTPAVEVDLCGHATLAAAHVLWKEGYIPQSQRVVRLQSRSGVLAVSRTDAGYVMDFPEDPPASESDGPRRTRLLEALSAAFPELAGDAVLGVACHRTDAVVEVRRSVFDALPSTPAAVSAAVRGLADLPFRGVLVTTALPGAAPGGAGPAFASRCFFPACGVDEDPVTGSAHCALAPYWAARRGEAPTADTGEWVRAVQGSSTRSGTLWLRRRAGSDGSRRVDIRGYATTCVRGTLVAGF